MPTYTSGPLKGVPYKPRYPLGVLLVNTEKDEVILYRMSVIETAEPTFSPRKIEPLIRDTSKPDNLERAWSEFDYDVLTYDKSRMGPWQL